MGASPAAAALPWARADIGVAAYEFDLGQVRLTSGRWLDNQNRTLAYLRFVDVDRLLYVFRANHGRSTNGAASNGGWDAPNFPFRSHMQGHFLTAWAQAYAVLGDTTCRDKANYMVAELAKCQASNGYLSGFPESDITAVENRTLSNGNVPYYCIHKTLAGLLDVWRHIGNTQARTVLLNLAGWVDTRTSRLSSSQMQSMLGTEFGGMNAVLTDLYQMTGDSRWLATAQRFDHAAVFNPLASNQDQLNGLHANTQVPKWIGAAREYKATGTTRYRDIAANAWTMTVERAQLRQRLQQPGRALPRPQRHRRLPEPATPGRACNTYNMLKLTRELWQLSPDPGRLLRLLRERPAQPPDRPAEPGRQHGSRHATSPRSTRAGGAASARPGAAARGAPDYNSMWCCQGTGIETNTKLMDSIYFHNGTTLFVNLFAPSTLNWSQRGITVTQTTSYPVTDTTSLQVTGNVSGSWTMRIRIPAWTAGRDDQRQRRAGADHHHPRQLRRAHPLLDLRRHGDRAAADACGHEGRQRQPQPPGHRVRPGGAVGQLRQHGPVGGPGADPVHGHPHEHLVAGLHRQRLGQPRPVLRRAQPQLRRLLGGQRRRRRRRRPASA